MESPNNPVLTLDVQKMQSWVAPAKLMYQGDKGYNQPFRLTNAWNQYDVKSEELAFSASKPDGQIIEIENEPDRFAKQDDVWYFKIPNELTQAVGTVTCFFYVKNEDESIVASTTKFSYQVEAKFNDEDRSNSYVSALERLEKIFEQYIENAKNQVNSMDSLTNEYRQKLLDLINELKTKTDKWLTTKSAQIDADISQRKTQLDKLNTEVQNTYDNLVKKWNDQMSNETAEFNSEKSDRSDDWNKQKENIQSEANEQLANNQDRIDEQINVLKDALQNILTQRDLKIKEIDADWEVKKIQLQTDIDDFKKSLKSQLTDFDAKVDELKVEIPKLTKKVDSLKEQIKEAAEKVSSINFDNYIQKAEFDAAMAAKASGIKIQGLRGDYVMAVDPNSSLIDAASGSNALADTSVIGAALQVVADAILDKNHYTKTEVNDLMDSTTKKIQAAIDAKANSSDLTGKADKSQIESLSSQLTAYRQENTQLKTKVDTLTEENTTLKQQVTKLTPVHVSSVDDVARQDSFFVIVDD